MYFQLQASTLPTEETGSGLWRTPTAMDTNEDNMKAAARILSGKTMRSSGQPVQITLGQQVAMERLKQNPHLIDHYLSEEMEKRKHLPNKVEFVTYLKENISRAEAQKITGEKKTLVDHWYRTDSGHSFPSIANWEKLKPHLKEIKFNEEMTKLTSIEWSGMLPTPNATDHKDKPTSKSWKEQGAVNYTLGNPEIRGMLPTPRARAAGGNCSNDRKKGNLEDVIAQNTEETGKTSQLNPQFVEEMMGFPENWTISPFQSGETNP